MEKSRFGLELKLTLSEPVANDDWRAWFDSTDSFNAAPTTTYDVPSVTASTAVPISTKQRPHQLGFFDLPAELRLSIYTHACTFAIPSSRRRAPCSCHHCCRKMGIYHHPHILLPSHPNYVKIYNVAPLLIRYTFSCISKQVAAEAQPVWYGSQIHCITDDSICNKNLSKKPERQATDFPKLKQYLRSAGVYTKSIKRICIIHNLPVSMENMPDKDALEFGLGGCDDLHPNLVVQVIVKSNNDWVVTHCKQCDGQSVMEKMEKSKHSILDCAEDRKNNCLWCTLRRNPWFISRYYID